MKSLPKSLHTVTVLVRVAVMLKGAGFSPTNYTHAERMDEALRILGYSRANDPYDLAGQALKQLEAL
jgi:hypothetical protein